jgi:hypothetical protein
MLKGTEIFKDCRMKLSLLETKTSRAFASMWQRRTAKTLYQKLETNIPRNETNS